MRSTFPTRLVPPCIGLLLLATGCLGLEPGPTVSILQSVLIEGEARPEFAQATGRSAGLTVSGQIVGKLPCDEVRAELEEDDDELEVTIRVVADRQFCNGLAPTTWSYVVNILNLPPGQTGVLVRYAFQGTDGVPGVRLDTAVVVG